MKVTVESLGRIERAEFDVRPLTVFVGPNNTNKSWAAFALAEIYRATSFEREDGRFQDDFEPGSPEAKAADDLELAAEGAESVPLQSVLRRQNIASPRDTVTIGATFADYLGVDRTLLSGVNIRGEFDSDDRSAPLFEELTVTLRPLGLGVEATSTFSTAEAGTGRVARIPAARRREYLQRQIGLLANTLRWRTVTFPVERHLLLPFDPGTAERLNTMAGFQQPVRDFLRWVGEARATTASAIRGSDELADLVERAVLHGDLVADNDSVEFTSAGVKVPVQAAASMVRSLAGLPLYLRRLARPGDAIVIDEPEMNAHPRAQLALAELFALLVNRGFRVVLTTHSPYILDQLGVLIDGHRLGRAGRERVANQLQLGTPEAFIDPEKVAVYEFADADANRVSVRPVLDRATGLLDASTFSRETDRIGRVVNAILDEEEDGA